MSTSATATDAKVSRPKTSRLEALDGLRGLAAVVVFAHHALVLLYGPLAGVNEHHWPVRPQLVMRALQRTPVAWVFNGTFAVSFFFVLSGFVLTRAMGVSPAPARIARLITARFLRLLPLVVLGTFFGYVAFGPAVRHLDMLLNLTGNDSHAYIHPSLLANHGLLTAIKQCLFVIWRGTEAEFLFDPPLWSIGIELKGSLLVYLLAGAFSDTPNRGAKYWVGVPLGICFMGAATLSFLAGMYVAERSRAQNDRILEVSRPVLVGLAALAFVWASVHPWNRHLWLPLPFNPPEMLDTAVSTACSVFLMAAGLQLAAFRAVLLSRFVQFLGHASYGLYVAHVPLLYLGAAPLLTWTKTWMNADGAAVLTSGIILSVSLIVGSLLISYIDGPVARLTKAWVTKWLDRNSSRHGAQTV
jgi:peptidoglycan/LPS O-acetylase OafA/YrhL